MSIESMMPANHLTSVIPFSCVESFPASGSFLMSQLCASGGQSIGASALASVLQWILISFRIDWLDLLVVQGTLKSLLQYHSSKASILRHSAFFMVPTLTPVHDYWKNHSFVGKVMSLFFNTLSRFFIVLKCFCFLRHCHSFSSKEQVSFNFMAVVTICSDFGAQENSFSLSPLFPHLFAMNWWDQMPWSSFFECWVLSQVFTLLFHLHQETL